MKANRYMFRIFSVIATAVFCLSCNGDRENAEPKTPLQGQYPLTVSAGYDDTDTRASLDPATGIYSWTAGDKVGLIITSVLASPFSDLYNIPLTGNESGTHTTFTGSLTGQQINTFQPSNTYNYYSYFPYKSTIVGTFPNIEFPIPSAITVSPDEFNSEYAPMVAEPILSERPIAYLDSNQNYADYADLIHFDYRHVMSYAAFEMDCNLLSQRVTSVTITNNQGTLLSGTLNINMDTGSGAFTTGSNSITVNITGGLNVGEGNIIYVPMPVADMSSQTFTIQFRGTVTNHYKDITIRGTNFERGKIHRLRVAPAAEYSETLNLTIPKTGYYYIEAWGGNGGNSACGGYGTASGGSGGEKRGLYYFDAGTSVEIHVGLKGADAGDRRSNAPGGASGIGRGGNGAKGGDNYLLGGNDGYAGGGGGGASGIKINSVVYLAAGGGSGGAGTADHYRSGSSYRNPTVWSGSPGSDNNQSTDPGNGSSATGPNGAGGNDGGDGGGVTGYNGGGGGSGGGGGYPRGGFGGGGGQSVGDGTPNRDPRGGAGGGGMNYVSGTVTNTQGYTLPSNSRPSGRTDGNIIITFLR